jgi:hypothetical protein
MLTTVGTSVGRGRRGSYLLPGSFLFRFSTRLAEESAFNGLLVQLFFPGLEILLNLFFIFVVPAVVHELTVVTVTAKPRQLVVLANIGLVVHPANRTEVLWRADWAMQTRIFIRQNGRFVSIDVVFVARLPTIHLAIICLPRFVQLDVPHLDGVGVSVLLGINRIHISRIPCIFMGRCTRRKNGQSESTPIKSARGQDSTRYGKCQCIEKVKRKERVTTAQGNMPRHHNEQDSDGETFS